MLFYYLAQADNSAGQNAISNLTNSIGLARATYQSWQQVWDTSVNQSSGLWVALVQIGLLMGGLSIIYLVFTQGKEIIDRQSWADLVSMFVWPIVVVFFLGNNGGLLAQSVLLLKTVGQAQVQNVLTIQVGALTFQTAISNANITGLAKQQVEAILNQCNNLPPGKIEECWASKQPELEQVVVEAEQQNGAPLPDLSKWVFGIIAAITNPVAAGVATGLAVGQALGQITQDVTYGLVKLILYALQWGFVNILEVALLLTALFAPIAMGMSLLPFQGRPIIGWLISFFSLIGMQLGYNIIVGLTSIVMVNSQSLTVSDVAFLFFLAVFAPGLAVAVAGGGGIALFQTVSNNVKQVIDTAANTVGVAVNLALKFL